MPDLGYQLTQKTPVPSGVNDEAPFNLLKNMPSSYWGAAASYPDCVANIVSMEAARQVQSRPDPSATGTPSHEPFDAASTSAKTKPEAKASRDKDEANKDKDHTRLHIHAFFAASDMLIGAGGKTYFDACLTDSDTAHHTATSSSPTTSTTTSKPKIEQYIRYESETVPGTNHETIVELLKGVVGRVFEEVVEGW